MPTIRPALPSLIAVLVAAPLLEAADFNGDGYADLAVGCIGEWVAGHQEAGAVHVFYGGPAFPGTLEDLVITEASFPDIAAPGDFELFGLALESGDFDGDGFDDLAMCVGNDDVSGFDAAGSVIVVYGSVDGLDLDRHAAFNQDTKGIKDKVEAGNFFFADLSAEQFGRTMAAGDFDGDGCDDLAVFVQETFGSKKAPKNQAGAIHVLKGGPEGLTTKKNKFLRQGKGGVAGACADGATFGWALAAADFDQDGLDDLAVGAPGNSVTPGAVVILYGKLKKGLVGKKSLLIDEAAVGGTIDPAAAPSFGLSLAAGAFSGGAPQLAIGAPGLDVGGTESAGAVYVASFAGGVAVGAAQLITRATAGLEGGVSAGASFGFTLEAGDLDGDGDDDLAVGAPYDLVGAADDAGSVTVLAGSGSGLSASDLLVTQDETGVPETAEQSDNLGWALAAADFDGDGRDDLIASAYHENVSGVGTAGALHLLPGSAALLDLAGSVWLDKASAAIPGNPVSNEVLGFALGR